MRPVLGCELALEIIAQLLQVSYTLPSTVQLMLHVMTSIEICQEASKVSVAQAAIAHGAEARAQIMGACPRKLAVVGCCFAAVDSFQHIGHRERLLEL